ncbi:MAG: NAD(P)-dependent oxidoreductase [Candidatus Spechtbacterales bacterium]|nr:NAD(P)-dependent oxidoreductase [Candidatus Spechtbacterales bacterium]
MKKIAITGAKGRIGTVLSEGLRGFKIEAIDLPNIDVTNYNQLLHAISGCQAIIHLAWQDMNFKNEGFETNDHVMAVNVYKAALEAGVKRVIMASSVHADNFYSKDNKTLLSPQDIPTPDSIYGASKIFMEALGRHYAKDKNLEVICIRFGGVNTENRPPQPPFEKYSDAWYESAVWLSHKDCVNLVNKCLSAQNIPNKYSIVYAVSENKNKIHDTSNPFGWKPGDKDEEHQ